MRKILFILFILSASNGVAQEGSVPFFGRAEAAGKVHLKWFNSVLYSTEEYTIERKSQNGIFVPLNQTAIAYGKSTKPTKNKSKALIALADSIPYLEITGLVKLTVFLSLTTDNELAEYFGMYYFDENAPSEKLTYQLKNKSGKIIATTEVDASKKEILPEPKNFTATPKNKKVLIDLEVENDRFYGYDLERSTSATSGFKTLSNEPFIASTTGEEPYFYEDLKLENETSYYYRIVGYDYFGMTSSYTKTISAVPSDESAPRMPDLIEIKSGEKSVLLNWDVYAAKRISHFNLYRAYKYDVESGYTKINTAPIPVSTTSFEDVPSETGLYYYKLEGVGHNEKTTMTKSNFGELRDFTPPAIPTGLKISAESGKFKLDWKQNKEGDFMGYWIYRTTTPNSKMFTLINAKPQAENSFEDKLPKQAKNAFRYYIMAIDTNENISEKSKIVIGKMPDVIAPSAPFFKFARVADSTINLEWQAALTEDIQNFKVLREVNGKVDTAASLGKNKFKLTDKPPFNTTINYTVLAIDSSGNISEASNSISAFVKMIKAAEKVTDFELSLNIESKQVHVKWEIKNVTELKGFIVYRTIKGAKSWMPISSLLKEGNYEDSSVKKLKSYEYQIRTYAQNGQVSVSPTKSITVQ
ncbi:MAG: hypothetical protein JKY48_11790 [Flavobacteriales bacterium]|nr:hypothetical protein [Flavobacteriales bacterium]